MKTINCEKIIGTYIKELGERFHCRQTGNRIWIISPYTYADGDYIEVSVINRGQEQLLISDFVETLRNLSNHGFDPRSTTKGKFLLQDILDRYEVELNSGRLEKKVRIKDLSKTFLDVLCACFATGDLLYLSRAYQPATFPQEVGHWLTENKIDFEPKYAVEGSTGKKYKVDFFFPKVGKRPGLLQTLSPKAASGIKPTVDSTIRLWFDIMNNRWKGTLLDDRLVKWKREDIELLKRTSSTHFWSEKEYLLEEIVVG